MEIHTIGIDLAKTVFHIVGLEVLWSEVLWSDGTGTFDRTQIAKCHFRLTMKLRVGLLTSRGTSNEGRLQNRRANCSCFGC
jgi:hypothetical protein